MVVTDRSELDPSEIIELDPEMMLTPAEASMLLGVSTKTVGRWGDSGLLPIRRTPGGHRRFRAGDVLALVPGRKEVGEP